MCVPSKRSCVAPEFVHRVFYRNVLGSMAVLLLFCLIIAVHAEPQYMSNIGYLGSGYDMVKGNPHAHQVDPGFRSSIVDMGSYKLNRTTPDHRFFIPDEAEVHSSKSCSYETSSEQVFGTTSYYDSLKVDASIDGGGWGFSFSASGAYQAVKASTTSERSVYIQAKALCSVYKASLLDYENMTLSDNFRKGVASLSNTTNFSSIMRFIDNFGTHFTNMIQMGSKCVLQSKFSEFGYTSMISSGLDVKAAAGASFMGFTGGFKSETSKQQSMSKQFDEARSEYTALYLGSMPSDDNKWETWAVNSSLNPYPFMYILQPISSLLTDAYFPEDPYITKKQQLLDEVLKSYCSTVPGCAMPEPDPSPVDFDIVATSMFDNANSNCINGQKAINCGINVRLGQDTVYQWSTLPSNISSSSCSCESPVQSICYASCASDNSVRGYSDVQVYGRGRVEAMCPTGSTVMGCSAKMFGDESNFESWPEVVPVSTGNGTGCSCWGGFGVICAATCSTSIKNHTIRSNYGGGTIIANCPAALFALGCGFSSHYVGKPFEGNPEFYASSITECTCFNRNGVTCYASCGTFD